MTRASRDPRTWSVLSSRADEASAPSALAAGAPDPLAAAFEFAGDSIEILDADFRFLQVNPAFERITGYSRDEVIGKTPGSLLRSAHFDDSYYETIEQTLKAGRVWRGELIARRRDGEVRYQEATISPVKDAAGSNVQYIAVKRDVTARRIAESALDRARTLLADAIESIPDGLAMFDVDDRLVFYNNRFLDAHSFLARDRNHKGFRFEELIRQGVAAGAFAGAAVEDDPQGWIDMRLYQHRRAADQAIEQRLSDGRWLRIMERRTSNGGIVGIWTDITELKRREAAVWDAKEGAELANRAKSSFLAQISHELRTPLNAVLGFAELIFTQSDGPGISDRYRRYAKDIFVSGEYLRDVIDDIIDISCIESGRLDLAREPVDVYELIDACTALLREQADAMRLTVDLGLKTGLPALWGDRRRLRQVLINLLSYAVKFTQAGGRIRVTAEPAEDGGMVICVADSGVGMSPDERAAALNPLENLDCNRIRPFNATGRGLPLAKKLVELHDGQFEVEDAPGQGTKVTCRFPASRLSPD